MFCIVNFGWSLLGALAEVSLAGASFQLVSGALGLVFSAGLWGAGFGLFSWFLERWAWSFQLVLFTVAALTWRHTSVVVTSCYFDKWSFLVWA